MKAAFAAAVAGSLILALWFGRVSPAANWTVLPQAQLISAARAAADHFGIKNTGAKPKTEPRLSKSTAYFDATHPDLQTILPLALQVEFGNATVNVDSSGKPTWVSPKDVKGGRHYDSDLAAATYAFQYLAGAQASLYKAPSRSAGDESHEQDYEWRKKSAKDRIVVKVQDSALRSAQYKAAYSSSGDDDDEADAGDNESYWDVLDISFGFSAVIVIVIAFGFYVLWVTRKVVNHQFPLRLAGAILALMMVCYEAGPAHKSGGSIMELVFVAVILACMVAIGRGISPIARPRWMSLEQLCLLAPMAKPAGSSIAAGILFSPLLLAIPVAIVACGLFPHSLLLPLNTNLLYSRVPLLESFDFKSTAYVVGLFGFTIPALTRLISWRRFQQLVVVACGIIFFADRTPFATGPLAVPLITGFCTFAVYWFVYTRFDLLAIITAQISTGLLLTILLLAEKGMSGFVPIVVVMIGGLVAAQIVMRRGQEVAEGDPRATNPTLSGFRAEREKLRAEFSVARRAQQDMLPQNPPSIPGYSIAASCTPSLEVGGDLYDFLKLPDGRVGIGVADVSGKGVPAALYMTLTKGLLSAVSKNNANLPRVVEEVNRHLQGVTRKKVFVTMALGFLDAESRMLQCVRAGHNPVVWRQASEGRTTLVSPTGLGLGITAGRVFGTQLKVADMPLNEGDAVVFYSDGITEAMNIELEQFGEERLMEAVERADTLDAAAARDSILSEVHSFLNGVHPQDDMTIVVLRVSHT